MQRRRIRRIQRRRAWVTKSTLETHQRGGGWWSASADSVELQVTAAREVCAKGEESDVDALARETRAQQRRPRNPRGLGGLAMTPEPGNAKKKHARGAAIERASSLHLSVLGSLTVQQWADRASELCDMHPAARKESSRRSGEQRRQYQNIRSSSQCGRHHSPDTTGRV